MKSQSLEILIVAASVPELEGLRQKSSKQDKISGQLECWSIEEQSFDVLFTGVGMVATAYHLALQLQAKNYDLVLNAGIAGSFDFSIALGAVFQVSEDCFADLGAEDGKAFLTLDELGFGKSHYKPYGNLDLGLKKLPAATVNTVHGNEAHITAFRSRSNASLESMEGAAVFYVCEQQQQKVVQIRSVSNYVEQRNRAAWEIPLAIKQLNEQLYNLLLSTDQWFNKECE